MIRMMRMMYDAMHISSSRSEWYDIGFGHNNLNVIYLSIYDDDDYDKDSTKFIPST